MPPRLNRSGAVVTTPDGAHENVSIVVRTDGRLRMSKRRELVAERADVVGVRRVDRSTQAVTFADGTEWTVTRMPCGCS